MGTNEQRTDFRSARSLPEIVDALEISENELRFHADRIRVPDAPESDESTGSTEGETHHLADLKTGYESAAHYIGILRRYQKGRLERQERRQFEPEEVRIRAGQDMASEEEDAFAPVGE
jgi:hypothetical protein